MQCVHAGCMLHSKCVLWQDTIWPPSVGTCKFGQSFWWETWVKFNTAGQVMCASLDVHNQVPFTSWMMQVKNDVHLICLLYYSQTFPFSQISNWVFIMGALYKLQEIVSSIHFGLHHVQLEQQCAASNEYRHPQTGPSQCSQLPRCPAPPPPYFAFMSSLPRVIFIPYPNSPAQSNLIKCWCYG